MKHKLSLLIVLIVLAATGIAALQVNWLRDSYRISKEKIATEAKKVLDEAIAEHKDIVALQVRRLLKKGIDQKDIETEVLWKTSENNHVTLGYRTKRHPHATWINFQVPLKELTNVQNNPYPLLLKRINESNLDGLENIYSTFIGIVDDEPKSERDNLNDSLMRCFNLHEDTLALSKIIKKRFDKIGRHFILKVFHQKGFDKMFNSTSVASEENLKTEKSWTNLNEKLDVLNAYLLKLGENEGDIYIAKPILDDIDTILQDRVSVIILAVKLVPLQILRQMLFSLIGSATLLLLVGFCLIYMFHTILKQKRLSEIKDDFISNVSHELKTPVATTLAAIQGMQHFNVLKDEKKTNRYLETAAKEMHRLSNMIDAILNNAIYERSDFNLHTTNFNLKEMLTELICIQESHSKKKVQIDLSYLASEEITADKTHLYNVFINLIDNAIKYGNESVTIKINCINTDRELKIKISDNGNGIPIAYQINIFDKFFRVPNPAGHSIKGHGLGLNYVKNIVEKHKGTIRLLKSDGHGSTFEINLPQ